MNDFSEFSINRKNKKVVFTNGCFDILHRGHISYLNEAKSLGDILVIGINTDKSVKRLKGEDRPVNNEADRAFMLNNLKAVDYVFFFEEFAKLSLERAGVVNPNCKNKDCECRNYKN